MRHKLNATAGKEKKIRGLAYGVEQKCVFEGCTEKAQKARNGFNVYKHIYEKTPTIVSEVELARKRDFVQVVEFIQLDIFSHQMRRSQNMKRPVRGSLARKPKVPAPRFREAVLIPDNDVFRLERPYEYSRGGPPSESRLVMQLNLLLSKHVIVAFILWCLDEVVFAFSFSTSTCGASLFHKPGPFQVRSPSEGSRNREQMEAETSPTTGGTLGTESQNQPQEQCVRRLTLTRMV